MSFSLLLCAIITINYLFESVNSLHVNAIIYGGPFFMNSDKFTIL